MGSDRSLLAQVLSAMASLIAFMLGQVLSSLDVTPWLSTSVLQCEYEPSSLEVVT